MATKSKTDPEAQPVARPGKRVGLFLQPYDHIASASIMFAGVKLFTEKERAILSESRRKIALLSKQLETVGHGAGKRELNEKKKIYAENPTPENFAAVRAAEDVEQAKLKCENARNQVKEAMKEENGNAVQVAQGILDRAVAIVQAKLDKVRAAERTAAEEIGIPFVQSESCGALENLIYRLKTEHSFSVFNYGGGTAAEIAQSFGFTLE